jgi:peptidoglycan/xylan/chitin deacetylase (PgdA/CDA1 family)
MKPKTVALTFDDGPDTYTENILNVFLEHNKKHNLSNKRATKATFFVIGKRITNHTCRLIERIYKEGHEIGNHTYSHPRFNQISPQRQREEIDEAEKAIKKCDSRVQVRWFRPPYGLYDVSTINLTKGKRLHIALWTIDTNDWRKSVSFDSIIQDAINTSSQDIVLMHDGREINMEKPHEDLSLIRDNTVNALPGILERFFQKNIEVTTLSEAFGLSQ